VLEADAACSANFGEKGALAIPQLESITSLRCAFLCRSKHPTMIGAQIRKLDRSAQY
jgi:hypothetical protein